MGYQEMIEKIAKEEHCSKEEVEREKTTMYSRRFLFISYFLFIRL